MSAPSENHMEAGLPERIRGPLRALVDALSRRRCLFWTGNVLVELERDFDPAEEGVGSVTMVLDADDFAALRTVGTENVGRTERSTSANLLSGLASLGRMGSRDQRMLEMRLRVLSAEAKRAGDIKVAADLLRASYELERV